MSEPDRFASRSQLRVLLLHERTDGHRASFLDTLETVFGGLGVDAERKGIGIGDVLRKEPLLSTMLEEHTFRFAIVATLRSMLGRRSVTLMFRPREAARGGSVRLRLKRAALRILRRLPGVSILLIVPLDLDPDFAGIASGWIYDPQLWDIGDGDRDSSASVLLEGVRGTAQSRPIVCALGAQNAAKGFEKFSALWCASADVRRDYLFVSAGKVEAGLRNAATDFERAGGVLLDRFVSDDELFALYDAADYIWCCYAPVYDQASGIFGRAVQFGRTPIVRKGSYLVALADRLGVPVRLFDWESGVDANSLGNLAPPVSVRVEPAAMRARSVATLLTALGLAGSTDVHDAA